MFSECVLVFLALFDIYSREPDFWAENQIFKNFSKSLKTCLVGVFWEFHGILALFDIWAKNILKMPQSVLSGVFWVFQSIFSIVRHLGRDPDFLAENRIFKKFLKASKHVSLVFSEFQGIFSIVRHLSREPDVWAENRIFKNFFKSLKTCFVGVFWVFQGILA